MFPQSVFPRDQFICVYIHGSKWIDLFSVCLFFVHVFVVLSYFYVVYMGVLSACMSVYHLHVRDLQSGL